MRAIAIVSLCFLFLSPVPAAKGIGGVEVAIRKKADVKPLQTQRTTKDGAFAFKNLPAGTYVLVVNAPQSTNPEAKSYFESRSNMRVEITLSGKKTTIDFAQKDGALVRQKHDMSKSVIQNIRAREAAAKDNEETIEVGEGQTVSGRITDVAPGAAAN